MKQMKNLKKDQTNFSSKWVPVGLDFTVAKGNVVDMHISKASCKVTSIKNC